MGETSLKHKILAIAEEEGAAQAGYALKVIGVNDAADLARFLSADPWPSPVKLRTRT